jgi:hypothetical protein
VILLEASDSANESGDGKSQSLSDVEHVLMLHITAATCCDDVGNVTDIGNVGDYWKHGPGRSAVLQCSPAMQRRQSRCAAVTAAAAYTSHMLTCDHSHLASQVDIPWGTVGMGKGAGISSSMSAFAWQGLTCACTELLYLLLWLAFTADVMCI